MKTKRFLAWVLSVMMIFTMIPGISLTASAEGADTIGVDGVYTAPGTNETYKDTNDGGILDPYTIDPAPVITEISFNDESPAYDEQTKTFYVSDDFPFILTVTGENLKSPWPWIPDSGWSGQYALFYGSVQNAGGAYVGMNTESDTLAYRYCYTGDLNEIIMRANNNQTGSNCYITKINVGDQWLDVNLKEAPTYALTILSTDHGTVSSGRSSNKFAENAKVTLTVTPEDGYALDTLEVYPSYGPSVDVTAQNDGKYTFTMPANSIFVNATFKETDVTASGYTGTYDGEAHGITVTAPEGAAITYSTDNDTYDAANPTYTNVGEYTVYYKVEKTDSSIVTGSAKVEITPLDISNAKVTLGDALIYNGREQTQTVRSVVVAGLTVPVDAYEISDNTATTVGTEYELTITAKENSNFTGSVKKGFSVAQFENKPSTPIIFPVFHVKIADDITGGEVTASKKLAYMGDTITITVAPDAGSELTALTVTNRRNNAITVTKVNDTTYTFRMPGCNVEIDAEFAKIDTTCPRDRTCPMYGYTDLDRTEWYHDGVHFCIENDLMIGTAANTFAPGMNTSRAMIVTILWRLEGKPVVNYAMSFKDVAADTWYSEAVCWAQADKIVFGYSKEAFGPNDVITREQIAAIMHRYAEYKGYDVSVGENTNILSYDDFDSISEYAIPSMQYAVGSGLMKGKTESTLNPLDNATRAEIAAILHRFIEANK